jgi:hypothetical protein
VHAQEMQPFKFNRGRYGVRRGHSGRRHLQRCVRRGLRPQEPDIHLVRADVPDNMLMQLHHLL